MRLKHSKLTAIQTERLCEHFVAGTPARTAAQLVGVNKNTAVLFFHRLRELIAARIEDESPIKGEIEVDECYFGGVRKGKRGRGAAGKVPVFGIPIMTVDADLAKADSSLRKTYLGTDNYQMGVDLAKALKAAEPKGGTVCLIEGGAAADNKPLRARAGFHADNCRICAFKEGERRLASELHSLDHLASGIGPNNVEQVLAEVDAIDCGTERFVANHDQLPPVVDAAQCGGRTGRTIPLSVTGDGEDGA